MAGTAASCNTPDEIPAVEEDVPFDPSVDDGVDTEVEKSGNLEFDAPDEG